MENENEVVTTQENKFEYKPLMFWKDITYLLQKIGRFFKSLMKLD